MIDKGKGYSTGETECKHLKPKTFPSVAPQCVSYLHKDVLCLQIE